MTCHVLHAGDGYTYLTNQVATGDVARSTHDPLVDYYTAQGNPPGQWAGSGCADLGMSGVVTEEHMAALFGEGLRPDANEFIAARIAEGQSFQQAVGEARLGRRFAQYDQEIPLVVAVQAAYREFEQHNDRRPTVAERRKIKMDTARRLLSGSPEASTLTDEQVRGYITDQLGKARWAVSGFDLVFSPAKSVSLLWALGGPEIRQVVAEVHEAAWQAALAYGEREAAMTRVGAGGVAQVDTSGFVATAFLHRDSRAGDPDLHTHVVVANRVRASDGIWRTLDGQQLFKVAVSMSEFYNAAIEQGLTERIGVRWVEVSKGGSKRVVREIDGMPTEWIRGFSRRRGQVEANFAELVADYVRTHGHTPSRSVQMQLAQQATLDGRPDKQTLKSLAEQVAEWNGAARQMLPGEDIEVVVRRCVNPSERPVAGATDLVDIAATVVDVVSTERSTWNVYHVRAEAIRQLKSTVFESADARMAAVESVVGHALGRESFRLSVELDATPRLLWRADGESVFHRHGSELYTSQAILDAETRLVEATRTRCEPVVTARSCRAAIAHFERSTSKTLNAGQRAMVEHLVACGRLLARAVGPPGTGKSTAMRAVREAWETTGGRVIGLAPSAAAASVLGDELGVSADTLHSLVVKYQSGAEIDVHAGDMLLIDESAMAGTRMVDQVRQLAEERGAVVRVVGDHRQLAAVEAGGWFRLLDVLEVPGVELSEVHRFAREDEAAAVLAFRVGDEAAISFYEGNHRLVGGMRAGALDRLYGDWQSDLNGGRTSIMISDANEVARELSARAQTDRRAAGLVEATGVELHDGTVAGVGDRVVTRLNQRRLAVLGGRDYVKNGDLWQVARRYPDGRLKVRHVKHHGTIVLPAWYVAEYTELGYAATIHRSQGLTVDVARSFLSPAAVREAALVALSRGIDGNYAYLDTEQMLAPDEGWSLPGDVFYRNRERSDAGEALSMILRREGAEHSATEELRDAMDAPYRLDTAVPQFTYALHVYRGPDGVREAENWVRQALPDYAVAILSDEAWPALCAVLHEARDAGADPVRLLRSRAGQRRLTTDTHDPAESVAKVLHYRVTAEMPTPRSGPGRPSLLPGWVPAAPTESEDATATSEVAEVGTWLRDRAEEIADRVHVLGSRVAAEQPVWAQHLGPVPDDPATREVWIVRAGQVAAYRERYRFADTIDTLLPGGERGEQARAHAWVERFLAQHSLPDEVEPARLPRRATTARSTRLHERLSELADRLNQPAMPPGDTGLDDSDVETGVGLEPD